MSYEHMHQAEGELKAQNDALLDRAKNADAADAKEPELDMPAEIERREVLLQAIAQARGLLEQRKRDTYLKRGHSDDDDRKPCD